MYYKDFVNYQSRLRSVNQPKSYMTEKARTFGLVLTGVSNEPFADDVAWFRHHGKPQVYFVFDLLSEICEKVFIVCDKVQKNRVFSYYPSIAVRKEQTLEYLPVLLDFLNKDPECGLLVVAACFPDLSRNELTMFSSAFDPNRPVAFFDPEQQMYQPLIAYYPPSSKLKIEKSIADGNFSVMEFLMNVDAVKYIPSDAISIRPINTDEKRNALFSMFIPPENNNNSGESTLRVSVSRP